MKLKSKLCIFLLSLTGMTSVAQMTEYNYERSLDGVSEDWHSITVPNEMFSNVSSSLKDIRIYGTTTKNDTIEVPYILKVNSPKVLDTNLSFEIINSSKTESGFYFTIKMDQEESIENILLTFKNTNFDWKVNLEGSQNQKEWFTILEDYRILDIQNKSTDYSFTNLAFTKASYPFFRIFVKSEVQPNLKNVTVTKQERLNGVLLNHRVKVMKFKNDRKSQSSILNIELENKVPVSNIKINVDAYYDYLRPIEIEYLADSVLTEKGWKYNYRNIKSDMLSSKGKTEFDFNIITHKLRVKIYNSDSRALEVKSVDVKGYRYELLARFRDTANYKLVYGNPAARSPQYDIAKIKNAIPAVIKPLVVGKEMNIKKETIESGKPLFENNTWLWVIMGIVVLILGGFTFKMLQNTERT